MTAWARHHAARRETERVIDRLMGREPREAPRREMPRVSGRHWAHAVMGRHGPPDPLTRLVLLALAASTGPRDMTPGRLTHAEIAARAALSERTVRDRLAWAVAHDWLMVIGPRTRRRYYPMTPSGPLIEAVREMRHDAPDEMRRPIPDGMRRPAPDRAPEEDDDGPEEELV